MFVFLAVWSQVAGCSPLHERHGMWYGDGRELRLDLLGLAFNRRFSFISCTNSSIARTSFVCLLGILLALFIQSIRFSEFELSFSNDKIMNNNRKIEFPAARCRPAFEWVRSDDVFMYIYACGWFPSSLCTLHATAHGPKRRRQWVVCWYSNSSTMAYARSRICIYIYVSRFITNRKEGAASLFPKQLYECRFSLRFSLLDDCWCVQFWITFILYQLEFSYKHFCPFLDIVSINVLYFMCVGISWLFIYLFTMCNFKMKKRREKLNWILK